MKYLVIIFFSLCINTNPSLAQEPEILEIAVPSYPEKPSGVREQGEVVLEVKIDKDGRVTSVQTISGLEGLRNVSEIAARQWRFKGTGIHNKQILIFAFTLKKNIGEIPIISSVFRAPSRLELFAEYRESVLIEDPPITGGRKKSKKISSKKK